ncbi:hypothetical protein MACK_000139 [Theileria orientalis]|uniref:RRM domain-containing protein n=1 Tax=Theileria orientalis TaxID=68886 RepID=A0A976MAZ3_THEOR|nr:hypothetical protein MACK_000139 [Theileria orientalis]
MPPKKTKRGTKKEKKGEVTSEEKLEEVVEEKVDVDETSQDVKLQEEPVDTGLDLDVDAQMDPFGQPTDSEAQKSEEELPNEENEAEIDNVNVDLSIEEGPEVLHQPDQPFDDEEAQSDDLLLEMGDLLNSLVELSSELEEKEEDEEEGAIREDEVPFERLPELNPVSSVLLLVNLPPELDSSRVLNLFKDSKLVTSVTLISKTQVKVFFRSQRVASEAKSRLDNMKLYNRRLQALYARDMFANNFVPPPAYPPMVQPAGNYNRMPNNFQTRNNNFFPHVPPPPNKTYTRLPQDKGKLIFNKYKLLNVTLQQLLLEFYNKMNLVSGTGKSKWDDMKSFFENQLAFDRVYQKLGITTRYILIGNLKESVLENSESVYDFLSRFTNNSYTYQIVKLPYNYPNPPENESLEDRRWLHVMFDKNRDGSGFFNKLNHLINYKKDQANMETEDPDNLKDLILRYSCPLSAMESLWISNVSEFCGYFKSEDDVYGFFNSLGVVKNFKLVYESGCIFVTFQNKDITTRIYNFLSTLSPKRVIKVSSYTNSRNNPGAPERVDLETELYPLEKDTDLLNVDFSGKTDNSFVLGQKLLNAIKRRADSQEVIDRLLKSNDISNFMSEPQSKRQRTVRPEPEFRRRDTPRFERRPYRDSFGRDSYGRSEYNRDSYPRDNYGRDSHSRDHYGREPYSRDSYRDNYRDGRDNRDNRDTRDLREGYGRDRDREFNRFRQRYPINKERVDRFGRTIRNYDRMRRDEPWKGPKGHPNDQVHPQRDSGPRENYPEEPGDKFREHKDVGPGPELDVRDDSEPFKTRSPDRPLPESPVEDGKRDMIYSKLLKRGKYICRVSCAFVRGDYDSKLPELLDVNQRANPERLKNCLSKSSELSLWQLGADSKDDSEKYDSLCDYLISKNRVALVQQGPYDVYIVPPNDSYVEMLQTPDANFMYAYLLPRSP